MNQLIAITYKNGTFINLEVSLDYYKNKYKKKSEKKLHSIFMKEYKAFVKALNKEPNIINVGKFLGFSNATISGKDVLSVDIKDVGVNAKPLEDTMFIPGIHDKVYLDLTDTRLDGFLDKLEDLQLIENFDKLVQKLVGFLNKSNVEFTIKAGKKPTPQPRKKKEDSVEIN